MKTILKPGDIFLTRGTGILGCLIRFFTRSIGEKRTEVNHVGIVIGEGDLKNAVVVEALIKVKKHKLWSEYGPPKKDKVAIFRPNNLTDAEIKKIVKRANEQVGKKYGFFKLFAHLLDWMFFGVYFFRRLVNEEKYPICSWLVADAYAAAGKNFGVKPGQAQPDDIWDYVIKKGRKHYDKIYFPLKKLR